MSGFFRPFLLLLVPCLAAVPTALRADEVRLGDGADALSAEYNKWADLVNNKLLTGATAADPADTQHQQAIAAAAKWATYRFDWGVVRDPGKVNEFYHDFGASLQSLDNAHEKGEKMAELFVKQVIARALEVETQSQRPIARINAARILCRIVELNKDAAETPADVLARLAGTNQGDMADALAAIIKDPAQNDGARYWAFRALHRLLALPPPTPPTLPRDKEEAALGTVIKFLQDHNKPFPPGTPQDEIDGFRSLRREAIAALAQCRYPTLADKTRPALILLKVAFRDGVAPEPDVAERVEAAIGVAHAQPALDKDYQPDYAAHQVGLFVADFLALYGQDKQANPDGPAAQPWRVQASRLIEALELMKAQTKDAHVAPVVDASTEFLKKVEKGLTDFNASDLTDAVNKEALPGQSLYKSVPDSTVKPANGKEAAAPAKPEEKKDK